MTGCIRRYLAIILCRGVCFSQLIPLVELICLTSQAAWTGPHEDSESQGPVTLGVRLLR